MRKNEMKKIKKRLKKYEKKEKLFDKIKEDYKQGIKDIQKNIGIYLLKGFDVDKQATKRISLVAFSFIFVYFLLIALVGYFSTFDEKNVDIYYSQTKELLSAFEEIQNQSMNGSFENEQMIDLDLKIKGLREQLKTREVFKNTLLNRLYNIRIFTEIIYISLFFILNFGFLKIVNIFIKNKSFEISLFLILAFIVFNFIVDIGLIILSPFNYILNFIDIFGIFKLIFLFYLVYVGIKTCFIENRKEKQKMDFVNEIKENFISVFYVLTNTGMYFFIMYIIQNFTFLMMLG